MPPSRFSRLLPRVLLPACAGALSHGGRTLGVWLTRAAVLSVKLLLLLYFVFAVLFLLLRYVVMPNIDHYKQNIEQLAAHAVGQPVSIERISATWQGMRPSVALRNVVIHDQQGQPALRLPEVEATLSWWSVPLAQLRLHQLILTAPDLDIRRDRDGAIRIGGIAIDDSKGGNGRGADWVLAQRHIAVRNGQVHWIDAQRGAAELVLQQVNFTLENSWFHHRAALSAVPPPTLAAPIDLRVAFDHPHFGAAPSDARRWTGELYADLRRTDLAGWKTYLNYPFELDQG
ncbi:MAG: AsmA family protein, partial [Pseudomonadota bacterium]|nr:AsmA family protein [Pseudomonadota bacterium]